MRVLPPPRWSERMVVIIAPHLVGMFRFLLEAYENAGYFTVLDARQAKLKIAFSPHQRAHTMRVLREIGASVPIRVVSWSVGAASSCEYLPGEVCL